MQANPDKFQAISIGRQTIKLLKSFQINDAVITCEENFKLLGAEIDLLLNFDLQVSNICKQEHC